MNQEPEDGDGTRGETGGATEALGDKSQSLLPSSHGGNSAEGQDTESLDLTTLRS